MKRSSGGRPRRCIILLSTAALLLLVGAKAWRELSRPEPYFADQVVWAPTPESLQDLVAGSHGTPLAAIVVGVIEGVAVEVEEPTPTPDATVEAAIGRPLLPLPGLPNTYLWLQPEQVLLTDGHVQVGQPIMISMAGTHAEPGPFRDEYPQPRTADRFLYFLTYEGSHYGVEAPVYDSDRGQYSRLVIDGGGVTYSDGGRSPVEFAAGTPPAEFVAAVTTEVARRYR